jgi:hypothetical protein
MHTEALTDQAKQLLPLLSSFEGFYLAGGTALALQIGHRISVDFDLFTPNEIPHTLLPKVKRVFADSSVLVSVDNPDELTGFANDVKITFLRYPYPAVLNLVSHEGLSMLSVKEIAATKAHTIGRRGSYKDYADLYFVLKEQYTSLNEIIDIANRKYGNDFNGRLFLEQLVYWDDIVATQIRFLTEQVTKEQIADFLVREIKKVSL